MKKMLIQLSRFSNGSKWPRQRGAEPKVNEFWLHTQTPDKQLVWQKLTPEGEMVGDRQKSAEFLSDPQEQDAATEVVRQVLSFSASDLDLGVERGQGVRAAQSLLMGADRLTDLSCVQVRHTDQMRNPGQWIGAGANGAGVWPLVSRLLEGVRLRKNIPGKETPGSETRTSGENRPEFLKDLRTRWIYGTDRLRAKELAPHARLISGRALVRSHLLAHVLQLGQELGEADLAAQSDFVVCVVFGQAVMEHIGGHGGHEVNLILFKGSVNLDLEDLQFTSIANATEQTIKSRCETFASKFGITNLQATLTIQARELLVPLLHSGGAALIKPYPAEVEFLGVPASRAWQIAGISSFLGLLIEIAGVGYSWGYAMYLEGHIQDVTQMSGLVRAKYIQALKDRLGTIVQSGSVDISKVIQTAQAMYVDGLTVSVQANRHSIDLMQKIPLSGEEIDPEWIASHLSQSLPKNCQLGQMLSNRQLTEVYSHVQCQSMDRVLRDLLDRELYEAKPASF